MPRTNDVKRAISILKYASKNPDFIFTHTRHREKDPIWGSGYLRPNGRLYVAKLSDPSSKGVINQECWLSDSNEPDEFDTHFFGKRGWHDKTSSWSDGGFVGYQAYTLLVAQCTQDLILGESPFGPICGERHKAGRLYDLYD